MFTLCWNADGMTSVCPSLGFKTRLTEDRLVGAVTGVVGVGFPCQQRWYVRAQRVRPVINSL